MIPLITLVTILRDAGCEAHITILGSLEDQVSFVRYVRTPYHPDHKRLFRLIDSVIIYEAEQALADLVNALNSKSTIDQIPNLVRWRNGKITFPNSIEVTNLNSLPIPDYYDLPLYKYLFPEPVFAMLSSRGCYWDRCAFCAITSNQLNYRTRNIDLVLIDLAKLQALYGVRWFHFRDMLMSPAYLRRFSLAILDKGLDIRWICRARFEAAFTRDILMLMANAGCVQIWFGFETASQRVLDLMDKGTEVSVVARILDDCKNVGMGVHMLAIHGFPSETFEEAEETVSFLRSLARTNPLVLAYKFYPL